jgi:hypothetical protein
VRPSLDLRREGGVYSRERRGKRRVKVDSKLDSMLISGLRILYSYHHRFVPPSARNINRG